MEDRYFSLLRESGTGKNVAVNPRLVRMITELDRSRVEIVFDDHHRVAVDGNVGSIVEHIVKALELDPV